jgi:hypothetical protein
MPPGTRGLSADPDARRATKVRYEFGWTLGELQ